MIPIDRTKVNDPSYRYKMPAVDVAHQGAGSGVTVIKNFMDICKALQTDARYCAKFISIELGSPTKQVDSTLVIKGKQSSAHLQEIIYTFIGLIVMCPKCKLPEVRIALKKSRIYIGCDSCGYSGKLNTNHKIEKYILKYASTETSSKHSYTGKKAASTSDIVWKTDIDVYIQSDEFQKRKEFVEHYLQVAQNMDVLNHLDPDTLDLSFLETPINTDLIRVHARLIRALQTKFLPTTLVMEILRKADNPRQVCRLLVDSKAITKETLLEWFDNPLPDESMRDLSIRMECESILTQLEEE